jgi:glutathione S-transferase
MSVLRLIVMSLRYSSWSMRPWLALEHAGARFTTHTADVEIGVQDDRGRALSPTQQRTARRALGTASGFFPVLYVDDTPIHESLAICEWVAESFPAAGLWPEAGIARARARAVAAEMHAGFAALRGALPCHVFARVPRAQLEAPVRADVERVFEIWRECLEASGGPFLFGRFGVPDAMFFPVLTRLRTYDVPLPDDLTGFADALEGLPAVRSWRAVAARAPRYPYYDALVTAQGGDPDAALPPAP